MVRSVTAAIAAGVVLMSATALPVIAAETGMAEIHAWRREGGKTCMVEHYHEGTGTGSSKRNAMRAAARSWAGFTSWEYGSTWGSYNLAASKSASCHKTGAGYSCTVQARPCKRR